jgi:hypothetical protein
MSGTARKLSENMATRILATERPADPTIRLMTSGGSTRTVKVLTAPVVATVRILMTDRSTEAAADADFPEREVPVAS